MSVIAQLEALPTSGLTVSALQMLDKIVPGEWDNQTSFDAIIAEVSGQTSPGVVAKIRQRAQSLETQNPDKYARAIQVYQMVDTVDQVAAGAAMASKVGDMFGSLSFLKKFTPKPETTQCLDAAIKLVSEVLAYGFMNGMPTTGPDGLARFAGAIQDYAKFDLVRLGGWVVFDGMLPLGPDFIAKIMNNVADAANNDALTNNAAFEALAKHLPGNSSDEKRGFIVDAVGTTGEWVSRFVAEKGITQEGVNAQIKSVLGAAAGGGDYIAAALDASTEYYSHTGVQTVARTLARHATDSLRDDVWRMWLSSQD